MKTRNRFNLNPARCLVAIALWLSAALSAPSAHAAGSAAFDTANQLYQGGKYSDALGAYQQLVKSGPWSANLFYNLGNTEWKLGNGGEAATDYERALALDPGNAQARENLDYVRVQTGGKTLAAQWWQQALGALDANTAAIVAAICGWAALFCLASIFIHGSRAGSVAGLIIALLAGGYAGGCVWEQGIRSTMAIVIPKTTEARVAPADVAPIADVLPAGTQVFTPEERGPWTVCTLPDGSRGWVATDALERVALPTPAHG